LVSRSSARAAGEPELDGDRVGSGVDLRLFRGEGCQCGRILHRPHSLGVLVGEVGPLPPRVEHLVDLVLLGLGRDEGIDAPDEVAV
jgi:hypothetical protein